MLSMHAHAGSLIPQMHRSTGASGQSKQGCSAEGSQPAATQEADPLACLEKGGEQAAAVIFRCRLLACFLTIEASVRSLNSLCSCPCRCVLNDKAGEHLSCGEPEGGRCGANLGAR